MMSASRVSTLGRCALSLALALAAPRTAPAQSPPPYDSAVAMIARRQAADDRVAVPSARSMLLTRGVPTPRAFVLLHGLTNSPRQFEALAYRLYAGGDNVFVPRFPQHGLRGGDARALAALTRGQLRGFADSVARAAGGLGDSVVVVGLSMGGTVAAWIAQHRAISRAVVIAPALEPGRLPTPLNRLAVWLAEQLPDRTWRAPPDTARPDREPGFSTRAIAELLRFGNSVQHDAARDAPRTRQLVVLVNANDRTVREAAAEGLAREWARHGAQSVSVLELPDSLRLPHNIMNPQRGRSLDDAVLALLRDVARGGEPLPLVRSLALR